MCVCIKCKSSKKRKELAETRPECKGEKSNELIGGVKWITFHMRLKTFGGLLWEKLIFMDGFECLGTSNRLHFAPFDE